MTLSESAHPESTISKTPSPKISLKEKLFITFKWVLSLLLVLGVIGIGTIVFRDSQIHTEFTGDPDKVVEIDTTTVTGYRDSSLAWRITAHQIWTGRNRYLFRGKLVDKGEIFDSKQRKVIGEIQAKDIVVNSRTRTVSVSGGVKAKWFRRGTSSQIDPIHIESGELRFFEISNMAYLSDYVVIKNSSAEMVANEAIIDTDANLAKVSGAFQVTADDFLVKSDEMQIFIDENVAELNRNIKGLRKSTSIINSQMDERERLLKSQDTTLRADFMRYEESDGNKMIRIRGNVKLQQSDKSLLGDTVRYNKKADEFVVEGNVRITSQNLGWAFKAAQLSGFRNPDIREIIRNSISISADRATFYGGEHRSFTLEGNVIMTQPDKVLKCQRCEYDDKTRTLTFGGGVTIVKNGKEQLTARSLILDLKNETFSADEQITGEFIIQSKSGSGRQSSP